MKEFLESLVSSRPVCFPLASDCSFVSGLCQTTPRTHAKCPFHLFRKCGLVVFLSLSTRSSFLHSLVSHPSLRYLPLTTSHIPNSPRPPSLLKRGLYLSLSHTFSNYRFPGIFKSPSRNHLVLLCCVVVSFHAHTKFFKKKLALFLAYISILSLHPPLSLSLLEEDKGPSTNRR